MGTETRVRYLRCRGPFLVDWVSDAAEVVVRITSDAEQESFGGYVIINSSGDVVEKSDYYGLFDEEADWFERQDGADCAAVYAGGVLR